MLGVDSFVIRQTLTGRCLLPAEEDEDAVGVDGLIQFCTDLDVPPDDMRMLVFCFNLQVCVHPRHTLANQPLSEGHGDLGRFWNVEEDSRTASRLCSRTFG